MLSYLLFLFLAKDGVTKVLDVLVKSLSGAVSVRKTVCKMQKKKGEKKPFMQQQRGFFFFFLAFSLFYFPSFLNSFFFSFVYSLAKQLVLVGCTLLIEKRRA